VWFARLDEISTHVRKCVAGGAWKPRVDRLPFWEAPMKGIISGKGAVRGD
jgi:hypothetical protein